MKKAFKIALVTPVALVGLMACAHFAMLSGVHKPAASEFGYGPRTSANGSYTATIEQTGAFPKGKLFSTVVSVRDASGAAVEGAAIKVDGGMPQHGHGLPTKPRVTKDLGNGRYQIDGVKFNMGGWWEFKLAISKDAVSDSITFNVDL